MGVSYIVAPFLGIERLWLSSFFTDLRVNLEFSSSFRTVAVDSLSSLPCILLFENLCLS